MDDDPQMLRLSSALENFEQALKEKLVMKHLERELSKSAKSNKTSRTK